MKIINDIFNRMLGKEKYVIFDKDYVDTSIIDQYNTIFNEHFSISKTDKEGIVTFVNDKFLNTFNLREEEIIGRTHARIKCSHTHKNVFTKMWSTLLHGKMWEGILSYKSRYGSKMWNQTYIYPIYKNNKIIEYLALRRDVSDIVELKDQVFQSQKEMILTLGGLVEGRNKELKQHVYRVAEISYLLAILYGLEDIEAMNIKIGAPIHDIGKITIPDEILNKPDKLSEDEFEIMKTHTTEGYNLLKESSLDLLRLSANISLSHHERYDGTGYPKGLKENEIPIAAQIVCLADVIDALFQKRVYKEAWTTQEVREYVINQKNKQFNPDLVDIYIDNEKMFLNIINNNS